jgi:4,5-DOPA dioxygenase extradiol
MKQLQSLTPTARLPALFLGHGSPMNVIEDNGFRSAWAALGARFGTDWPRPQLILCVSAHWLTQGWWLTGMAQPRTIHDFGGFPQELFDQQYPAPGAPLAAAEIAAAFDGVRVGVDQHEWGLDHGAWGVLKPMFPAADVPVVQMSMDYARPPEEHFALGREMQPLREQGVLIVASGNIVHNLRTMRRDADPNQAYDWAQQFDAEIARRIEAGELESLAGFQSLGQAAQLSQPTHEHYLPLLYAAGAAQPGEPVRFFNEAWQGASISMRSAIWG